MNISQGACSAAMTTIPLSELRARFQQNPLSLINQVPGYFLVNKASGITSHDVVDVARRRLRMRRVGHGGTLDPLATGLLVVLAGNATRLFDQLQTMPKTYEAGVRLGERTDTHDIAGTAIAGAGKSALPVAAADVEHALARFRGEILQTPPMFSALKRGGKKLYQLARQGRTVPRDPRPVTVYGLTLLESDGIRLRLRVKVSSGFYVRVLVDDLGQCLGTGAVMTDLHRTAIGPFSVNEAVPVEEISA